MILLGSHGAEDAEARSRRAGEEGGQRKWEGKREKDASRREASEAPFLSLHGP